MKLLWILILLSIVLCAATSLVLLNLFVSSNRNTFRYPSMHLLVFSVFHTIVCIILYPKVIPSSDDAFDGFSPPLHFGFGEEEDKTEETTNTQEDEINHHGHNDGSDEDNDNERDGDGYYRDSDGYDSDDDDDGREDDVGWDDDEEGFNDDLESRIEGFIAKVIAGWKEELSRDTADYVD